jgi:Fe2+ transport protein
MSEVVTPDDWRNHRRAGVLIAVAAAAVVLLVILVNVLHTNPPSAAAGGSGASSTNSSGSGMAGMPGMTMATTPVVPSAAPGGIMTVKAASLPAMPSSAPMPMAMVPLGNASWEGMSIQARTSAPATFVLFNGSAQQLVKPTKTDSFHLMVLLSDEHTGFAIPYSSVWATIRKGGKIVFDERLWPMISRYMGPHYGNNVALPAAGVYHLTLLVSPPAAARHLEYKNLWLKPHRVQLTFRWEPRT